MLRDETGVVDEGSTVSEVNWVWNGGWTESTATWRVDSTAVEVYTTTYDDEGRTPTSLRESATNAFNPVREGWSWTCQ